MRDSLLQRHVVHAVVSASPSAHAPAVSVDALPRLSGWDAPGSRVDQVIAFMARQIESGRFVPGARLPSVRNCARTLNVSCETAVKAYARLVDTGCVEARPRSGFYVSLNSSARSGGEAPQPGGVPGPSRRATLEQLISHKLGDAAIRAGERELVLAAGRANALRTLVRACIRVGETVLIEDPAPIEHRSILKAHGIQAIAVPRTPDGPDLDALRDLCKQHSPRMFLCSAALHDPTSFSSSAHKSLQLLRLADSVGLTIIEDDSFGDLLPAHGPGAVGRLASLDGLARVIYMGGLSATLGRSLGVHFIAAKHSLLADLRAASATHASTTSEASEIVAGVLASGRYERHCDDVRLRLRQQRQQVVAELHSLGLREFKVPAAGRYLWLCTRERAHAIGASDSVLLHGPAVAPGSWFSDSADYSTFVRIDVGIASQLLRRPDHPLPDRPPRQPVSRHLQQQVTA